MRADGRTRERKELRQKDEKKQRKDKSRVGRCLPFFRQQLAQRAACGCCYWGSVVEGVWCSCGSRGEGERGNERERESRSCCVAVSSSLSLSPSVSLSVCVSTTYEYLSRSLCGSALSFFSSGSNIASLQRARWLLFLFRFCLDRLSLSLSRIRPLFFSSTGLAASGHVAHLRPRTEPHRDRGSCRPLLRPPGKLAGASSPARLSSH